MTNIVKSLENLKISLLNRVGLLAGSRSELLTSAVKSLRAKQLLLLSSGAVMILFGGLYLILGGDDDIPSSKGEKPTQKAVNTIATPLSPVDERETWVNRVEKKAEGIRQETAQVHQDNQILMKRVDVLEDMLKVRSPAQALKTEAIASTHEEPNPSTPAPVQNGQIAQQRFPPPGSYGTSETQNVPATPETKQATKPKKRGPKIIHLTGQKISGSASKSPDLYLPAGTYCKAVVDMGVAASTAINSQGNPEPIKLRLVDDGNLPGGLKGQVKDAVLIGACYGIFPVSAHGVVWKP